MTFETTLDGILDSRLMIEQPAKGFRVAIDTVLMAHFTPLHPHENLIEFGCGVGGALLALAARVPDAQLLGLDIQEDLVSLCRKNIARNGFDHRIRAVCADLENFADATQELFDHVMMNPPYHAASRHDSSPLLRKKIANTEKTDGLQIWIAKAHKVLRDTGRLTLIHRADRQDEIEKILSPLFSTLEILPLVPKEGKPPKRVIVVARKSGDATRPAKTKILPPLILHTPENTYTREVENILRGR